MLPLSFDVRSYYRKHQDGESVSVSGDVTPTFSMDGPFKIAFRPGGASRTIGEGGYSFEGAQFYCIVDGCKSFTPGDILTSDSQGNDELYRVELVKTFPTEQQLYVRGL